MLTTLLREVEEINLHKLVSGKAGILNKILSDAHARAFSHCMSVCYLELLCVLRLSGNIL